MIQPGFMVLQSNRLENLRQLTTTWLRDHPLSPLEDEVLLVQSNGMAQWLKLALASDIGIASALDIMLPGRFQWRAYRAVLGNLPETSPFDKPLLSWRLLRLLPDLLNEEAFGSLRHFLQHDHGQRKHYQLAQRLADLFDQYQVYRADWLNDWAAGRDQITRHNQREALPEAQLWQAELWRRLLADMPDDTAQTSRAQIHQNFLDAAGALSARAPSREQPVSGDLPRRVVVFGLSSLPGQMLDVLAALAGCTQVILCVQNPSSFYWGDIVEPHMVQRLFSRRYGRRPGRTDLPTIQQDSPATDLDTLFVAGNPLLAAWGKQGRDYLRLLDEHDQRASYEALFQSNNLNIDVFEEPSSATLLGAIQADVFHLRSVAEAHEAYVNGSCGQPGRAHSPAHADTSLSFHIAHSAQREVEVLQDHLLSLFDADPDLKPRDVLVMVPDINQFAPHIQAVFGRIARDDIRFIPFTVSDQGKRQQAPLYRALGKLLEVDSSRFTVSDLLDLIDVSAVQAAFQLDDGDRPLLHRWLEGAGVRWGLNANQRQHAGMSADLGQNTWQFGLQRMLLGYASGEGEPWLGIEPFPEVAGLSAAIAGRLARLVRKLDHYRTLFQQPATVEEWTERVHGLMRDFFAPQDNSDLLLIGRIEQDLEDWLDACRQAEFTDPLPIEVVRDHLLGHLDELEQSQRFLMGAVNFATLMPMRAIPFRHICLLGLNDTDYPRPTQLADFDLMRQDYRPGDRSRREDDRYLFLEGLLSARESLYLSWAGRDVRDNSERPPSVLVAQLRDYISATAGDEVLSAITHEYPLQPFSLRYFRTHDDFGTPEIATPPSSGHPTLEDKDYTFAHEWERRLPSSQTQPVDASCHDSADPLADGPTAITLAELVKLLRDPAAVHFQKCMGVNFSTDSHAIEDDELFAFDGLTRWQFHRTLLDDACQLIDQDRDLEPETVLLNLTERLQRRGSLALPPFGRLQQQELVRTLSQPLAHYQKLIHACDEEPDRLIEVATPDNRWQLEDVVRGLLRTEEPDTPVIRCVLLASQIWSGKRGFGQGQIKWHYLAKEWPTHLAAQLAGPVTTWLIGPDTLEVLAPMPRDLARKELQRLLQLWAANLDQPLVAAIKTSTAWLTATDDEAAVEAARQVYDGDARVAGESTQSYALSRLWPTFADMLAASVETASAEPTPEHTSTVSSPRGFTDRGLTDSAFTHHSTALYKAMVKHWDKHRHGAQQEVAEQ